MSQYEGTYLACLKCELRKRDGRVTGRKWELFQQATTAETELMPDGVYLTYLMLEHYFKIACNVYFFYTFHPLCLFLITSRSISCLVFIN